MSKLVQFRVESEEDVELLKEAAWQMKMSMAEWLRKMSLSTAKAQIRSSPPR